MEDSVYTHRAKELFNPATLQHIASSGDGNRITYRVKSGDYLGRIASRYHVSVAQLKKWNHLRSNNLRVGQVLVIYGRGSGHSKSASKSAANASAQSSADKPSSAQAPATAKAGTSGYETYVVKKGDTLYSIAKLYPGVSANDIMSFNGISSSIKPGMKIKIPKK